jgi:hypothetical protein
VTARADSLIGMLCGGVGFGAFVQRLGHDVGTIRPRNGAAFEEEPSEVLAILQRLEYGTRQPFRKIDRPFYAAERVNDFETPTVCIY